MFYAKVIIPNETGLHARPASGLVKLCKSYKSTIQIIHGEENEKVISAVKTDTADNAPDAATDTVVFVKDSITSAEITKTRHCKEKT